MLFRDIIKNSVSFTYSDPHGLQYMGCSHCCYGGPHFNYDDNKCACFVRRDKGNLKCKGSVNSRLRYIINCQNRLEIKRSSIEAL